MEAIYKRYQEILSANPNKYYEDYQQLYKKMEDSPAYYHGQVIPFLYQPLFFSDEELKIFKELTSQLTDILNKVIAKYLSDGQFRSYFSFSKELEELILADPGYSCPFPMTRFDIFYYGGRNFKFCELNTDGSSGAVKTNTLEKFFLSTKAIDKLKRDYQIAYAELIESWIDNLLENYRQFNPNHDKPNIAIMDFEGYGMVKEFECFRDAIKERGYQVEIIDPRELDYRDNKLYSGDFRVDLIYRRAVTLDLIGHYDEIEDFVAAYLDGNICVVGGLRSQIIHNKIIFALLQDSDKVDFLSKEEQEFIKQHIPYTRIFNPTDDQLFNYVKENRESLVLKPMDLYGADGVAIGRDLSQAEWEARLDKIEGKSYLVQEFCLVPEKELAVFGQGKLSFEPFKYTLGLFLYNQDFKGIYTRAGKDNVIASATGCVTLPNLIID
ncbi:ATP-grasp domain-containing protein [Orenia metallireducens]|uniref:Circularly permuted ATP-grasp type 2 n=1 Tax=Orenia metallireducens TaxID=1413210 RepID=A0A285HP80_9FIRM|nr:circularly permuted type 2 ATP-grasp protein [Orenia metallireducens]PRX27969.1 ATP-grasp domain-containing protein [Orenia metallireducens]SNY37560.1 Circularly permuted ATP-grasp type 2 [Orenia metallireducens]